MDLHDRHTCPITCQGIGGIRPRTGSGGRMGQGWGGGSAGQALGAGRNRKGKPRRPRRTRTGPPPWSGPWRPKGKHAQPPRVLCSPARRRRH